MRFWSNFALVNVFGLQSFYFPLGSLKTNEKVEMAHSSKLWYLFPISCICAGKHKNVQSFPVLLARVYQKTMNEINNISIFTSHVLKIPRPPRLFLPGPRRHPGAPRGAFPWARSARPGRVKLLVVATHGEVTRCAEDISR